LKVARKLRTGARDEQAWRALTGGAWAGPLRVTCGDAEYAGALRLVDVDDDERRAGVHAQARRLAGWGGITLTVDARLAGSPVSRALVLLGDAAVTGDAEPATAEALLDEIERRLEAAVRALDGSAADDPAWRRQLALRAAVAVGIGVAAGLAGAAWDRRRRT
jgi:hypothetical protein